jgi:hypothetical protein
MIFDNLTNGQVFVDAIFGGTWEKISANTAKCMESDSAFQAGDVAHFKPNESVELLASLA